MSYSVLVGDVGEQLRTIPDGSVHCCVTSPPYYGLRDYGVGGQIGLEETPAAYVERLVSVFREVRRVLRDDGTLWLNLGDSYGGSGKGGGGSYANDGMTHSAGTQSRGAAKQLLGIPWRVAFALQADGWYLRQDIIWHKLNPKPESVRDRCTKAHEYVFLLSKSPRYYFDAEAIKEESEDKQRTYDPALKTTWVQSRRGECATGRIADGGGKKYGCPGGRRNRRDVWTVTCKAFKGAHSAVFPPDLVEPCVKAGTSQAACGVCGSPTTRVVSRHRVPTRPGTDSVKSSDPERHVTKTETTGWIQSCTCVAPGVPATVLDPFSGSGTTLGVAECLGRNSIGIELNPEYAKMTESRVAEVHRFFERRTKRSKALTGS